MRGSKIMKDNKTVNLGYDKKKFWDLGFLNAYLNDCHFHDIPMDKDLYDDEKDIIEAIARVNKNEPLIDGFIEGFDIPFRFEDVVGNVTIEDLDKYRGYNFCINIDELEFIVCYFNTKTDPYCFEYFKITDDMTVDGFNREIKKLENSINELHTIQKQLTIRSTDLKYLLINKVNKELKIHNLNPIPVVAYKNRDEVINEITKANPKDLKFYWDSNPAILSKNMRIADFRNRNTNEYGFSEDCYESDEFQILADYTVPLAQIFQGDCIVFQPYLDDAAEIKKESLKDIALHKNKSCDSTLER